MHKWNGNREPNCVTTILRIVLSCIKWHFVSAFCAGIPLRNKTSIQWVIYSYFGFGIIAFLSYNNNNDTNMCRVYGMRYFLFGTFENIVQYNMRQSLSVTLHSSCYTYNVQMCTTIPHTYETFSIRNVNRERPANQAAPTTEYWIPNVHCMHDGQQRNKKIMIL